MAEFPISGARDLDLGSGHTAYRHASLVDVRLVIHIPQALCGTRVGQNHSRSAYSLT